MKNWRQNLLLVHGNTLSLNKLEINLRLSAALLSVSEKYSRNGRVFLLRSRHWRRSPPDDSLKRSIAAVHPERDVIVMGMGNQYPINSKDDVLRLVNENQAQYQSIVSCACPVSRYALVQKRLIIRDPLKTESRSDSLRRDAA